MEALGAEKNTGPEVGQMKKGDYMIHIYLQEGKQFKSANSNLTNPVLEITCCDKKKYSSTKKEIGPTSAVQWSEHVFFEPQNMDKNAIETAQIQIRVLNKGLFKDDIIGAYDFDVTYVYFQPKHALFHQWIGMSNPEGKDFNEITCYLKLSISIAGPGDEQVPLNDSAGPENTEETQIMMPPSIKKEFKQVKFRFIMGQRFPQMDTFGTIDAYIQTIFMKKKLKTKVVTQSKNTHETPIEQEFWLPIQWPMASDRLVLKIWDEDNVTDEIVGSMFFSLKQIVKDYGPEGVMVWQNLYGSPLGVSGSYTDKMNENPEIASTWKGRILMHISSFDTKSPEIKCAPLEQEYKVKAQKDGLYNLEQYELLVEYGSGICLPGNKKYTLRISINDFSLESSKPKECKESYCRWSERTEVTNFECPYKSVEALDRLYIYLMDGSDAICFWRGKASDFTDPNPQFRWFPLTADMSKGKVTKQYEAGMVSLKISLNHKSKNGIFDFKSQAVWKKPPPKRMKSWKIRCFIFQCKDIPAADDDGTSDPYISLWNQENKKIKTQTIEDNLNPIFFEALELYYDYDSLGDAPPIVFNIWDSDDSVIDSDDYLGRVVVDLRQASVSNDDTIPEPKWHDMKIGFLESDPPCGSMLVSFSVVEDDYTYKIPIDYLKLTEQIEYKDYQVEINVLGLRELESFGLMPVKKPFIRFQLRSLLPPEKSQAVTNIKTSPSATGNNPNINTMINFQIDLPVNPLFCPKLQCDVFDYVYKGLVQPLLGTFTISIGEIMQKEHQKKDLQLKESANLISVLKEKVKELDDRIQEEEKLESEKGMEFESRVKGFNEISDGQNDSSRLITEEGKRDKEKLLQASSEKSYDISEDEEKKSVSGGPDEEEKKVEVKKSELRRFEAKTPLDFSPTKMKGTRTVQGNIFQSQNKLQKEVESGLNYKLLLQKAMQKQDEKQKLSEQRLQDKVIMKQAFADSHKNVLMPQYKFDERLKIKREANKPPATLFMELGYNEIAPIKDEDEKKHYRRFYEDELENNQEIFKDSPFYKVDVVRGQSRGASGGIFSFFSKAKTDDSGEVTTKKKVGIFKGRVNIANVDENEMFKATRDSRIKIILSLLNEIHQKMWDCPLEFQMSQLESFEKCNQFMDKLEKMNLEPASIIEFLKEQSYNEMISRQMLTKTKCVVRVYILEGYDFAQRDIGSFSDPYLKLSVGKKKYNERDNYQLDEPNPKFFKSYEFDAEFPGSPNLVIKAYDYDDLFGDDLIGKCSVDLDDRFFCPEWQQIEDKPIEFRQLYHPSSQVSQGVIKMWVEIHMTNSSTKSSSTIWDVSPAPVQDYEVRLVVYDTLEVIAADVEGTTDCFIKAFIDDKDKKETDTHYRCQNGQASFNYRLVYNVQAPRKKYLLTIQVWDRDLFKSNDFIGETQLDLSTLFEDVMATQKPITMTKKYFESVFKSTLPPGYKIRYKDEDSFYVECYDSAQKMIGKVRIGINITPGEQAKKNLVGQGRTEPNHSPFLPPPFGRISFTMNPFKMLNQLIGPELRRKIYGYCCLAICIALCVMLFPLVFSNLVSSAILKIFS